MRKATSPGSNGRPRWRRKIADAKARGDDDLGDTYYLHWLAALESLVVAKGILSDDRLARRRHAWARAVERTPHGEPIQLAQDDA